ncbi:MAG: phosphatidate cytidylyltransferase [Cryobacterium sp.]|jgi:phosphatidate cytidylyltransferase|nr:phosphatidate cytidylyltransferase [Cryobacterium sp.]
MPDEDADAPPAPAKNRWRFRRADIEARADATREEIRAQVTATRAEIKAQMEATRAQIDHANEKIEARTGRNLPLAILIGLALGFAMLFSLIVVKELFMIVAAFLIGFTAFELASALRASGRRVPRWPTVIAALATVPAAFYLGDSGKWYVSLAGIGFVVLWRVAELAVPGRRGSARDVWRDLAAGSFIQVYIPFLASFAVLLAAKDGGEWWTLAFLILVISVDTGAYATGLTFGKHPMAPRISPKKTWEGFAGSVAAATIAGILVSIFMIHQPWWFGFVFGGVIVATATIGDLTESLLKRDLGIKDISTWLPGHGGFLDRMDSIVLSSAAAYILFLLFA